MNILIIGSDANSRSNLENAFNKLNMGICRTVTPDISIYQLEPLTPDIVILGPELDNDECLRCIHRLKILNPALPILTSMKIETFSWEACFPFEGIFYIKPLPTDEDLLETIDQALSQMNEKHYGPDFPLIIGQSSEICSVRERLRKIADKDITALITGETGTGKELASRSIHIYSRRNKAPLVKIDCTSLPDELLESEIFGFQKGAFTDAYEDKPGRLELAHGGTLFIDEIGDLSLSLQVKLLQIFEDKEFTRLGATEDQPIDVRVVAATNSNLWEKVREKKFRNDLFYRLSVMQIEMPPLRKRKDDILLLAHYFIDKYSFEYKRKPLDLSDKVVKFFLHYHWPGNIRELENIVRRAIAFSDWDFIFNEFKTGVTQGIDQVDLLDDNQSEQYDAEEFDNLIKENDYSLRKISKVYISNMEKKAIKEALQKTNWNRTKAAKLLGVSYKTLINRIQEFDITP